MPGAELAADARIDEERQKTCRSGNTVALDDGSAVVERRSRQKDAREQIVGDQRVEGNAPFDVVTQADLALDHDNRAGPPRRQVGRGDHQLLDRFIRTLDALEVTE